MPRAQPAGVSLPPWTLPGNSSVPVSRQPMPRMWASPSPRTRSQTPCSVRVRLLNGSSGLKLALGVRPKGVRHHAIGAEHDNDPLLAALLVGERKAREITDERRGRRGDAEG